MGTRILVRSKLHKIPGDPGLRQQTMADIVCRHVFGRDFDDTQDRVHTLGFDHTRPRCFFLLDNGPPDSREVTTSMYTWDGSNLTQIQANPMVKAHLQNYPFNPANAGRGYTDEEFRQEFGEEKYKSMMAERIRVKKRSNMKLFPTEMAFMQDYPGLVEEV